MIKYAAMAGLMVAYFLLGGFLCHIEAQGQGTYHSNVNFNIFVWVQVATGLGFFSVFRLSKG